MPLFLEKVASGNYLVPKFQRDFVWTTKQIVDLFDSIIKGFPIGSIIMWKPDGEEFATIDEVGGITVNPASSDISYILDGRQRITAMITVLYKDGGLSDRYYIDLEEMSIVRQFRGEVPPHYLKLSDAFDSWYIVEYIEKIKGILPSEIVRVYSEKAKMVNKNLLSYEVGYITVFGGKIDDAVEIFSRLNSKGIDISADYMIQALTYNYQSGFLFSDKIKEIIESLVPYCFDSISRDTILKCIYNHTGKPFIDCKTDDIIQMPDLPVVVEKVKQDIVSAVDFLSKHCGVRDIQLLPYIYQLVMLSMFFKENKMLTEEHVRNLKQWFFYTSYISYFTNTSLANIRKDIEFFGAYSKGLVATPMMYQKSHYILDGFPDYLRLGAVRSCCLLLTTIIPRLTLKDHYKRIGFFIPQGLPRERKVGNAICFINEKQKRELRNLFERRVSWDNSYEKFFLNIECVRAYFNNDFVSFESIRKALIKGAEKDIVARDVRNVSLL